MIVAHKKKMWWVAAQLRNALGKLHEKYPVTVGAPSFYAALGRDGFIELPAEFAKAPAAELASGAAHRVTTIKEVAISGRTRFFVGSILTPRQGYPDTMGNNDGGATAQTGNLIRHSLPFATFQSITPVGNGVKSFEGNIIDGNLTTAETLQVTGNGAINNVQTSTNPIGTASLSYLQQSATAYCLYDVPTNTLNGGVGGSARFIIDIVYINAAGTTVHNTVVALGGGQTAGKSLASVALPAGWQQVQINITAETVVADTSGSLLAHVYQFYVDVQS